MAQASTDDLRVVHVAWRQDGRTFASAPPGIAVTKGGDMLWLFDTRSLHAEGLLGDAAVGREGGRGYPLAVGEWSGPNGAFVQHRDDRVCVGQLGSPDEGEPCDGACWATMCFAADGAVVELSGPWAPDGGVFAAVGPAHRHLDLPGERARRRK